MIAGRIDGAPHETLLVVDATTGQNGLQQARLFSEAAGVTGVALTKLDGSAKGGVAIAIAHELGSPLSSSASVRGSTTSTVRRARLRARARRYRFLTGQGGFAAAPRGRYPRSSDCPTLFRGTTVTLKGEKKGDASAWLSQSSPGIPT